MYRIIKGIDGKFYGQFRLQDSTEKYTFTTVNEAIKKAIDFAKVCNNQKITKKDISFVQEVVVEDVQEVPWKP